MKQLTVVARIKAKPGLEDRVKQGLLALIAPTRKEEGCLNYDLHQSLDDKALFLFYENWASQEVFDRHLASAHVQAFLAQAGELLAESPDIRLWEMVSEP